jgi:glycerol-3-phosphate O-acyltransferase
MACKNTNNGVRALIWLSHKVMRQAVQGLQVDSKSVERVKSLIGQGHRVVLLPIYKSFVDPFVLSYVLNYYQMEQPFIFGNFEDSPEITVF